MFDLFLLAQARKQLEQRILHTGRTSSWFGTEADGRLQERQAPNMWEFDWKDDLSDSDEGAQS